MPSRRSCVVAVLLSACGGGEVTAELDAGTLLDAADVGWHEGLELADRPCPPDSFLAYDNFGAGFLAENCSGCHGSGVPEAMRQGAPVAIHFDTLAEVRALAPRMYLRAGDGYSTMPPAGGPSGEARQLFGEWLACGAPR